MSTEGEAILNSLIGSYKSGANLRKLPFILEREDCIKLFKGNCVFCGCEPFNEYVKNNTKGKYIYNGIDRINSKLGYTNDNVQSCCKNCNFLKKNLSDVYFITQIKKIYENLYINQ